LLSEHTFPAQRAGGEPSLGDVSLCGVVTLESGKTVRCKLLVSVEMGGTTLRDVRFVSPLEALSDRGKGTWQGYTAVGEQRD
jgi:hypothetical protein